MVPPHNDMRRLPLRHVRYLTLQIDIDQTSVHAKAAGLLSDRPYKKSA